METSKLSRPSPTKHNTILLLINFFRQDQRGPPNSAFIMMRKEEIDYDFLKMAGIFRLQLSCKRVRKAMIIFNKNILHTNIN